MMMTATGTTTETTIIVVNGMYGPKLHDSKSNASSKAAPNPMYGGLWKPGRETSETHQGERGMVDVSEK